MAIPKHDELRVPILSILHQNSELKLKDFIDPLAKQFNLTEAEIQEMYPSGNGHIFYDRVSWALSYLNMAGLLDKPKRGVYKINESGIQLLKTPEKVNSYIDQKLLDREPTRQKKGTEKTDFEIPNCISLSVKTQLISKSLNVFIIS